MGHQSHEPFTRRRVAVLFGGDSDEAEISRLSGTAVMKGLADAGHFSWPIDPAEVDLRGVDWSQFDVAFLALHGEFGEDGQVQEILDRVRIPYTGSNATASRLAFSKRAAKEQFTILGIPTPLGIVMRVGQPHDSVLDLIDRVGLPMIVKPDAQGSSLGVSVVRQRSEIEAALKLAFRYGDTAIVEQAIIGTEWTVGLLDDSVFPAIEIRTRHPFFDYEAKYLADDTEYVFEYSVPLETVRHLESVARRACAALGTRGLVRVDLRLDAAGQPWVLEVNTIPGFTSHSLVPKAAARIGIDFPRMCHLAIESCLSTRASLHPPHWMASGRPVVRPTY